MAIDNKLSIKIGVTPDLNKENFEKDVRAQLKNVTVPFNVTIQPDMGTFKKDLVDEVKSALNGSISEITKYKSELKDVTTSLNSALEALYSGKGFNKIEPLKNLRESIKKDSAVAESDLKLFSKRIYSALDKTDFGNKLDKVYQNQSKAFKKSNSAQSTIELYDDLKRSMSAISEIASSQGTDDFINNLTKNKPQLESTIADIQTLVKYSETARTQRSKDSPLVFNDFESGIPTNENLKTLSTFASLLQQIVNIDSSSSNITDILKGFSNIDTSGILNSIGQIREVVGVQTAEGESAIKVDYSDSILNNLKAVLNLQANIADEKYKTAGAEDAVSEAVEITLQKMQSQKDIVGSLTKALNDLRKTPVDQALSNLDLSKSKQNIDAVISDYKNWQEIETKPGDVNAISEKLTAYGKLIKSISQVLPTLKSTVSNIDSVFDNTFGDTSQLGDLKTYREYLQSVIDMFSSLKKEQDYEKISQIGKHTDQIYNAAEKARDANTKNDIKLTASISKLEPIADSVKAEIEPVKLIGEVVPATDDLNKTDNDAKTDTEGITQAATKIKNLNTPLNKVIETLGTVGTSSQYAASQTDWFADRLDNLKQTLGTVNIDAKQYAAVLQYLGKVKTSNSGEKLFNTSKYESRLQGTVEQLNRLQEKLNQKGYSGTDEYNQMTARIDAINNYIEALKKAQTEQEALAATDVFETNTKIDKTRYSGIEGALSGTTNWASQQKDNVRAIIGDYDNIEARINSLLKLAERAKSELVSMQKAGNGVTNNSDEFIPESEDALKVQAFADAILNLADNLKKVKEGTTANQIVDEFKNSIKGQGLIGDEQLEKITTLRQLINALGVSFTQFNSDNNLTKALNQATKDSINTSTQVENLRKQILNFMNTNNSKLKSSEYWNDLNALYKGLDSGTIDLNNGREIFSKLSEGATKAGLTVETLYDRLTRLFGEHWQTAIVMGALNGLQSAARQVITNVQELDTAMVQLKIVTESSSSEMSKFAEEAFKVARITGQSAANIMSSAEEYSRLGYSLSDSLDAAQWTSIISNVGAIDTDSATEGLTAIIKAYGLDISDMERIGDELVKVDKNFASSVSGLIQSLERTGSSLYTANTTLEESIALATAANESVQNPERVGNALKNVSARIRSATAELDDMGEEYNDIVSSTPKYRAEILALTKTATSSGVDILDNAGNYKSIYDIMVDIQKVWKDISDVNQAALLEDLAGKQNSSIIAGLLNSESLVDSYQTALSATGTLMQDNATYLDSIKAKISQFQASFQALSTDLLDSDAVKNVVDLGTKLIDILDKLVQFQGSLSVLISTLLGAKTLVNNFIPIFTDVDNILKNITVEQIGSVFKESGIKSLEKFLELGSQLPGVGKNIADISTKLKLNTLATDQQIAAMQEATGMLTAEMLAHNGNAAAIQLETVKQQALNVAKKAALGIVGALVVTLATAAITTVITKIVQAVQNIKTPAEQAAESLAKMRSEFENAESDVSEVESKLEELQKQIEAAGGKTIEDIVDPEERAKLEATNALLQSQLELKQQIANTKANEVNEAAADVVSKKYYDSLTQTREVQLDPENSSETATIAQKVDLPTSIKEYSAALNELTEKRNELVLSNEIGADGKGTNDAAIEALDTQAQTYIDRLGELEGALPEWEMDAENVKLYTDEINKQTTALNEATAAMTNYNNAKSGTAATVDTTNADALTEKLDHYKERIKKFEDSDGKIKLSFNIDDKSIDKWIDNFEFGGVFEGWSKSDIEALDQSGTATGEYAEALVELRIGAEENNMSLSEFLSTLQRYGLVAEDAVATTKTLTEEWESWNTATDAIQSAYSTMTSAQEEYNKYGYLSIDTLQSMLELDDKYWANLDITNGKINLNAEAYENLMQAQYDEAMMLAAEQLAQSLANDIMNASTEATGDQIDAQEGLRQKLIQMVSAWGIASEAAQNYLATALMAQGFSVQETVKSSGKGGFSNNQESVRETNLTKDGKIVSLDTTAEKINQEFSAYQNRIKIIQDQANALKSGGLKNQLGGFDSDSSSASDSAKSLSNNLSSLSGNLETLTNAAKEYNAYGAISIETLDSLYGLSDEYTKCLEKQDGQLVVNTESFLALLQNEIAQAKAAEAAGDSDGENAKKLEELNRLYGLVSEAANGTTISIEELTNIINGFTASLDDAQEKGQTFQNIISGMGDVASNKSKYGALTFDDTSSAIDLAQTAQDEGVYEEFFDKSGAFKGTEENLKALALANLNAQNKVATNAAEHAILEKQIEALNQGLISGTDYWMGYNHQIDEANDKADEFQSAWTDLNDVIEENNTYGYITQDSYQKLIALDDEYLSCLEYQNGKLSLNTEAFKDNYVQMLRNKAAQLLLKTTTEDGTEIVSDQATAYRQAADMFTQMADDVASGSVDIADHLEGAGTTVDNFKSKFSALKSIVSSIFDLIGDSTEDTTDTLKIYGEAVVDEIDARIEALEEQKDVLEDANDEEERAIELAKLQDELARAKTQKTVRLYTENGFEWSVDESAVSEAEENLSDQQREWNKEDAEAAIDEQIDALNDLKEKWEDVIDNIGKSWDEYQTELEAAATAQGLTLDDMETDVDEFSDAVIANMKAIAADESLDEFMSKAETVIDIIDNLGTLTGHDFISEGIQKLLNWGKSKSSSSSASVPVVSGSSSDSSGDVSEAIDDAAEKTGEAIAQNQEELADTTEQTINNAATSTETKQQGWFSSLKDKIETGFNNVTTKVGNAINGFKTTVSQGFSNLGTGITNLGTNISNTLGTIRDVFSQQITNLGNNVSSSFSDLGINLTAKFNGITQSLGQWFNTSFQHILNLPTTFSANFNSITSGMTTLFETLFALLSSGFSTLGTTLNTIMSYGGGLIESLTGNLGDWLVGGMNAGSDILGGITDGLFNSNSSFVADVGTNLLKVVQAVTKSGTTSGIGSFISSAISLVGTVLSFIAAGGVIPDGGTPKLYANGGFPGLTHGTHFIAGENGPEVVGHINGQTEVMNRFQLADVMKNAVTSGMSSFGGVVSSAVSSVSKWIKDSDEESTGAISSVVGTVADIVGSFLGISSSDTTEDTETQAAEQAEQIDASVSSAIGTAVDSISPLLENILKSVSNIESNSENNIVVRDSESGAVSSGSNLLSSVIGGALPVATNLISSMLSDEYDAVASSTTVPTRNTSNSISMGNVVIENPVGDSDTLAKDIISKLPTKLQQRMSKR